MEVPSAADGRGSPSPREQPNPGVASPCFVQAKRREVELPIRFERQRVGGFDALLLRSPTRRPAATKPLRDRRRRTASRESRLAVRDATARARTGRASCRDRAPSPRARAPTASRRDRRAPQRRSPAHRDARGRRIAASCAAAMGAHSARISPPHSRSVTSPGPRSSESPGSRPRAATRCLLRTTAASSSGRVGRAFVQQTVQQEHVEKAHRVRGDADRVKGIEVHQAHLDVLDAAVAQRVQRPLAGPDHALRAGSCRRTRSRSAAGSWRAGGSRRRRGCRPLRRPDRAS